jgi:uncharacterized membrane protein YdbT with pleckstrin-like domain
MSQSDTIASSTDTEQQQLPHKASTTGITLLDGEQMLANLRPSWEAWLWQILVGGLFLLTGLAQLANGGSATGFLIGLLVLGYVVIARWRSRYFVTDERVVQRSGLLRRSTNEVRVEDIEGLKTDARLLERVLRHGHIVLSSAATTGPVEFKYLSNHKDVANTIRELQRD